MINLEWEALGDRHGAVKRGPAAVKDGPAVGAGVQAKTSAREQRDPAWGR